MNLLKKLIYFSGVVISIAAGGCANMGTPSGGPRDEDPPRLVSAVPPPGSTGVTRNRIVLNFNELVNVKDAFTKVVVSPPSKSVPRVSASGRRVTVEFDSLVPNTTYTIDFADAIEDNNEGNKLTGFAYSFATGEVLDTLRISGRVLSARNLEPMQGMLVGVHAGQADSAFLTQRLLRVARTDDRGRFTIRGLAPGAYRVFALGDKDNDYRYSSPEEDVAFYDVLVEPSARQIVAQDSVYNPLTGALDSVVSRGRTQFLPNDIVLRSFNSELRQQYMSGYERLDSTRVFLKFNTRSARLPRVRILGFPQYETPGVLEAAATLDSLIWWLPQELMRTDSLKLEVSYDRSDQNLEVTAVTDTLDFITKRMPVRKNKKSSAKARLSVADSVRAVTTAFEPLTKGAQDVWLPLGLETPAPLARFDTTAVRLSVLVDSTYVSVPSGLRVANPDSLQPRRFEIMYPWTYGTAYRLEIDSLAAEDIYGKMSRPLSFDFKTKTPDDYCSLAFTLRGLGDMPSFVELLDNSDAVVRTAAVNGGEAYFPFLTPGRYFARVILDADADGLYTTGSYAADRQPELAYYYPKAINIKKKWDQHIDWDVFSVPVDMMKPAAVLKNKPAADRRSRKQTSAGEEEEEDVFDPTRNPFDPNDRGRQRRR